MSQAPDAGAGGSGSALSPRARRPASKPARARARPAQRPPDSPLPTNFWEFIHITLGDLSRTCRLIAILVTLGILAYLPIAVFVGLMELPFKEWATNVGMILGLAALWLGARNFRRGGDGAGGDPSAQPPEPPEDGSSG